MSFGRAVKRGAMGAGAPTVFLLLVAYFSWQATQGPRGLASRAQRDADLVAAKADQAQAAADLSAVERRVAALRNNHLDVDALDERARAMLNLSDPLDIVVPLKGVERVF